MHLHARFDTESGPRHAFAPHLARRLLAPGQAPPGSVTALQTTLDGAFTPIHARILAPTGGTIIALDPDIPSSRQRMLFEAEPAGASARWALNGEDLGPTTRVVAWRPQPGTYTLSLVDGERRILDTVAFEVRGRIERIDD